MSSDEAFEESDQTNAGCGEIDETQLTCDALCSLSSTLISNSMSPEMANGICAARKRKNGKESDHTCSKQLQLPMFLTSKFGEFSVFPKWLTSDKTSLPDRTGHSGRYLTVYSCICRNISYD